MVKNLKVISLFSGCGGADLGLMGGFTFLGKKYKKNPISIIHASDIDEKAVNTYNENFKHRAIVEDVCNLDFQGVEADIVIGGFPCQNFSTVNPTKIPEKKSNQLFWQMGKVVDDIKPKMIIVENVKGFFTLRESYYYNMAKKAFEKSGYHISSFILNAADYGVPQKRERLIMIGIRNDLSEQTIEKPPSVVNNEKQWVPLKKVIKSLIPEDEKYYFSKKAVEGVKRAKKNMKRAVAQDMNGPCLTISSHLAKVSLNSRDPVLLVNEKKELYRRFSTTEAARIQSFPENFIFIGSEGDAYRQIGNAVPPVMMWHIVKHVLSILKKC